jgi:hypothetical protein
LIGGQQYLADQQRIFKQGRDPAGILAALAQRSSGLPAKQ